MKSLDYLKKKEEFISLIHKRNTMVLATCLNNRVTARTVFTISNEFKIYFITSSAYLKYKQIIKNPNIALCFDNIQIEGVANVLNHPFLIENKECLKKCESLNDEFLTFAKYKNAILIEVTIENIESWRDGGREYLNVNKNECYRIG